MAKYALIYHGGGGMPETEEEGARLMAAWGAWMEGLGDALLDGGAPFGPATTIASDGSTSDGGGANPATGYSFVQADSVGEAVAPGEELPDPRQRGVHRGHRGHRHDVGPVVPVEGGGARARPFRATASRRGPRPAVGR